MSFTFGAPAAAGAPSFSFGAAATPSTSTFSFGAPAAAAAPAPAVGAFTFGAQTKGNQNLTVNGKDVHMRDILR